MVRGAGAAPLAVGLGWTLLQPLHPLQQRGHHPQRLFAQPFDRTRSVERKSGPYRPAHPAVGTAQGLRHFTAKAWGTPIQLLLQREEGIPPMAAQLLLQSAQATGWTDAQLLPVGMGGQGLAPALHLGCMHTMGKATGDAAARRFCGRLPGGGLCS